MRLLIIAEPMGRYLEQVLHSHDESTGPGEPKFSNCSWATVFNKIAAVKEEHSAQGDMSQAKLLGMDLMTRYIDVIPEEYGLGVIKGALGLIFEVRNIAPPG